MITYQVWENGGCRNREDANRISATDPRDAAQKYAQWSDQDSTDFSFASGSQAIVVIEAPDGNVHRFTIDSDTTINYYAKATK